MAIIHIAAFKCDECGNEWLPTNKDLSNLPSRCSKCGSPNWNKNSGKKLDSKKQSNLR
ncbi:MAG TPA: hypothetical protein VJ599_05285 [Nitrososphaeraceae archaeon]|nr:hypothetical protein [Nitrososphaeraceae archaeon]